MKYIFYSFLFLFLTMLANAQRSIDYVSFFPPAHIVQNEITLKQNGDSFDNTDLTTFSNTNDYDTRDGGLILGAADKANIMVSTMTVKITASDPNVAIKNFNVDNFIKVTASTGTIGSISIGAGTGVSSDEADSFFLSAGRIKFILTPMPSIANGLVENSKMYSSDIAAIGLVKVADPSWSGSYVCPPPTSVWGHTPSNFIPGLSKDDKLVWCNLRIDGHETCRKYLVQYKGDTAPCSLDDDDKFCRVPNGGGTSGSGGLGSGSSEDPGTIGKI